MASTFDGSPLKIELIGTGDQAGTWGSTTNQNFKVFQEAITGSATVDFDGNATKTLDLTDSNASQEARNLRLNIIDDGGGSGARTLYLGSDCQIDKLYIINNTLADEVTVQNYVGGSGSGESVAVPAGKSKFVFNDGTDIVEASNATSTIDLTSDVTGILPAANGGTGNGFFAVSGPTSTAKTFTFPDANTTIAGLTTTQTFTNKRITPRIGTTTSTATLTVNADTVDQYNVTALAEGVTITAPSGTPTNGQKLIIRLKDNGTSRSLSWATGSSNTFRVIGNTLPAATPASKTIYVGCVYNTEEVRWDVVAVAEEA